MSNLTQLAETWQTLLTTTAIKLAVQTGFTKRAGPLNGAAFAQTLLFGFLDNPAATLTALSATAFNRNTAVSAQAIDQRFSERSAEFMQSLLEAALQVVVNAPSGALGLLQRFSGVYVLDSSTIMLPDQLASRWAGCGGRVAKHNLSALKFNLLAELNTGHWQGLSWMDGRAQDRSSGLAKVELPKGALRLADLGYFNLQIFGTYSKAGVYWLSRVRFGTSLFDEGGVKRTLAQLLKLAAKKPGTTQLELAVKLGVREQLAARLVAVRVPKEVAALRRQRLRKEFKREGKSLSSERLYLCEWTVYVTNLKAEQANIEEVLVLGRVRWQVELIFKLWKSQGLVDQWRSGKPWRILTELYAKMLGILLEHWLMLNQGVASLAHSQVKAHQIIQQQAQQLLRVLADLAGLAALLAQLGSNLRRHCQRTKRGKAFSLFQLLLNCT